MYRIEPDLDCWPSYRPYLVSKVPLLRPFPTFRPAPGLSLVDAPLLFLDVETTGRSPRQGHRICEVALLPGAGVNPSERFVTLINPTRPVTHRARGLHGLDDARLSTSPPFAEVANRIASRLGSHVLVGHHVTFDLDFLANEFDRLARIMPPVWVVDTLSLARRLIGEGEDMRLGALVALLELRDPDQPLHRAEADAWHTRALFGWLVMRFGLETLADVGAQLIDLRTHW